jgi:molecular chaperone HtpG
MKSHAFVAEVSQVLHLVIHSLYSNKEIFLRELISNSSDALDKLRFRALTEPALMDGEPALEIRLRFNEAEGVLVLEDTGIGMSEEELTLNLGTVAHSGTRKLVSELANSAASKDLQLIGQFGVGFYSAFLVADRVRVVSRAAGATSATAWTSDGKEGFTTEPADKLTRGTEVHLHLKDEHRGLLSAHKLEDLVRRYSDYVAHPIFVISAATTPAPTDEASPGAVEAGQESRVQANRAVALWQRAKADVKPEEYNELYKHLTHDYDDPLSFDHFKVEGTQLLAGVLYIPKKSPFDLFDNSKPRGVSLFVKRVFIMEDCDAFLPPWLRFLRGVVDSDDLPLNVSRELLQDSQASKAIKKQLTRRGLGLLEDLAENRKEDFLSMTKDFGQVLKEGVAMDPEYRDRLAKLLRFNSTSSETPVSFAEYKARMKEGQKGIYYLYGTSKTAVATSPFLEVLRERGIEVLLMTDAVDEWVCDALTSFESTPLLSVQKEETEPDAATKDEVDNSDLKELIAKVKGILGERISEVKASKRLVATPACLSLGKGAMPAAMESILRASGRPVPPSPRIFELNPSHSMVTMLAANTDQAQFQDIVELLFDQAKLAEGSPIEDPAMFGTRLGRVLEKAMSK